MDALVLSAIYANAKEAMTPKYKYCHRLLYIADGEAVITVHGKAYKAEQNAVVIISNYERYDVHVTKEPYKQCTVSVSPYVPSLQNYPLLSMLFNRPAGFNHLIDTTVCNVSVKEMFAKLVALPPCDPQSNVTLLQLFQTLQQLASPTFHVSKEVEYKIARVVQCKFQDDIQQKYSLSQLADEHHLSVYYFSHLFKRITGYSLMGYLRCCRMAAAKRYLVETPLSIEEIVALCGFSDSNNFGRAFKAETGLSPSKFRERYTK